MKNDYSQIQKHRVPPKETNAVRFQPPGRRFSFLAIDEEIGSSPHHGFGHARRLKIVKIEQSANLYEQEVIPRLPRRGQYPNHSNLLQRHPDAVNSSKPNPQEFECWLDGKNVHLRELGEVVQDEAGNFYEKQGQQIRPLDDLVMDEAGRFFEIRTSDETVQSPMSPDEVNRISTDTTQGAPTNGKSNNEILEAPPSQNRTIGRDDTAQPEAGKPQQDEMPAYQKLLPDPGIRVKLTFAHIKQEIISQLRHPAQLDDNVLIECYAQFYEAQRTLPAAHLAVAELGDGALQAQFHPLTRDKARMLGVIQLFKPSQYPFETNASTRQLYPGQRVYRLWPVFDPTATRKGNHNGRSNISETENGALRCQIPSQYMNPLQFRYSREEVLYDMRTALGALPPDFSAVVRWFFIYPSRLLKTFIVMLISAGRMKKWRALLKDKSPDEQLWSVTPPAGFSFHPTVRRWTFDTLSRDGYDAELMALEWEIYWRRRGYH